MSGSLLYDGAMSFRTIVVVAGLVLVLWAGLRLAGPGPEIWSAWEPDGCSTFNCYCEAIRPQLIRQTIATESNLGFATVALLIAGGLAGARTRRHWLAVGALAATALGSAFYHASLTRVGDWADLMGTYGLAILFATFAAMRRWPDRSTWIGLAAGVVLVACGVQMAIARELQQLVFGGLILAAIVLEVQAPRAGVPRTWLWAGLACFAIGAMVWIGDASGRLPCWPEAPLTWHGLWHLLAAGAAGLLCRYHLNQNKGDA